MSRSNPLLLLTLVSLSLAGIGHPAVAQGLPFSKRAIVRLTPATITVPQNGSFAISLTVDLSDIRGTCGDSFPPAVLGGYIVTVRFDPARLRFESGTGCGVPQLNNPTFTERAQANSNGRLVAADSSADSLQPTGLVCVARMTFTAISSTGNSDLQIEPSPSISSALQFCSATTGGPANIPSDVTGMTVSFGVPQSGDANGDGLVAVSDVFHLINALFASGPGPFASGDADGSGDVSVADVFYLINYLFAGGPAPR